MKDLLLMVGLMSIGPGILIFFGLTCLFVWEKIPWARKNEITAMWLCLLFVAFIIAIIMTGLHFIL